MKSRIADLNTCCIVSRRMHGAIIAGDCAMTQLARVRAGIRQIDERPAYRILVERSVATYLWDWLTDAMREFTGK